MSYPGTRDFKIRVEAWNKKTKQGKSLLKIKVHSFFYIHKHTLAPSSHLVMRHAPPPAEWFIFHLIWTLEVELNPWRDYWLSPQKNSISLTADVSERLQPFPSMLYLNRGSWLELSGWMTDISYLMFSCPGFLSHIGRRHGVDICWHVLSLRSMIRWQDAEIM